MTTTADRGRPASREPMGHLLHEVVLARERLGVCRTAGRPEATREARSQLCDALTAYTDALTDCAMPLPYAVRDELWLLQHVPW